MYLWSSWVLSIPIPTTLSVCRWRRRSQLLSLPDLVLHSTHRRLPSSLGADSLSWRRTLPRRGVTPRPCVAETPAAAKVARGEKENPETVASERRDDRNPNSIKVGNFQNASGRPSREGDLMYRLYFKGLVSEETGTGKGKGKGKGKVSDVAAGFGVAICDQRDTLLFESKGQLVGRGANRQGAEIQALTRGLTEAWKLGIKHVSIFCDSFPIFQFVRGSWTPKQKKIAMLMDDLQRIRQQFSFTQAVLVAGNQVKYAYKLARESIVSQANPHENPRQAKLAARKEECLICFNDIDPERMFSIGKCTHRFAFSQHVEVKLLHGMIPNCPHDKCNSEMVIDALLTPKLGEMWKQRIKENAIPVTERVYCPYLRCSALMSKTKISESAKSLQSAYPASGVRRCVECRGLFCVDCKVPWHGKLSCTEYKKLHPNPPADDVKLKSLANNKMWRQCDVGMSFATTVEEDGTKKQALVLSNARHGTKHTSCVKIQLQRVCVCVPNNYFDDYDEDEYEDYEADEDFEYEDYDADEDFEVEVEENAIPVTERVYCHRESVEAFDSNYFRCMWQAFDSKIGESVLSLREVFCLMSKTKISESAKSLQSAYPASGEMCGMSWPLCVDCKVPWHGKLSCTEYKKLHPNPPADDVKLKSLAKKNVAPMWASANT
ncbi:LOW QUALITY PROTEIN: hypothetical protein HID58_094991 [Brassica napus]|uniref:IBR domain-containing protein n=1 Tax=Brassica napus TaxID=3708 RepID=A0ABQ7X7M9_BRANA|nr:LOW QUALITY PROTEIN: hypothetical protein HID58_094991 [Brassica napus]